MAKKDTDPCGIYASMDLVKEISEMNVGKFTIYSHTNSTILKNKAIKIVKKFKNDYDKAGGKL